MQISTNWSLNPGVLAFAHVAILTSTRSDKHAKSGRTFLSLVVSCTKKVHLIFPYPNKSLSQQSISPNRAVQHVTSINVNRVNAPCRRRWWRQQTTRRKTFANVLGSLPMKTKVSLPIPTPRNISRVWIYRRSVWFASRITWWIDRLVHRRYLRLRLGHRPIEVSFVYSTSFVMVTYVCSITSSISMRIVKISINNSFSTRNTSLNVCRRHRVNHSPFVTSTDDECPKEQHAPFFSTWRKRSIEHMPIPIERTRRRRPRHWNQPINRAHTMGRVQRRTPTVVVCRWAHSVRNSAIVPLIVHIGFPVVHVKVHVYSIIVCVRPKVESVTLTCVIIVEHHSFSIKASHVIPI